MATDAPLDHIIDGFSDRDTDVLIYCGDMQRGVDTDIIRRCIARKANGAKKRNVLFLLVTNGGDPDPAFRVARCLQQKYEHFALYVSGPCKSAGTLVATGAQELVFSDFGELGPLDVQFSKKDDLLGSQSGFVAQHAMESLSVHTFEVFERVFLKTIARSGGRITVTTAGKLASEVASNTMSPIYGQIDPMYIGEVERANMIGSRYGTLLLSDGKGNLTTDALKMLIAGYPSHSFVIDRQEAQDIFKHVREPDTLEIDLAELLQNRAREHDSDPIGPIFIDELRKTEDTDEHTSTNEQSDQSTSDSQGHDHDESEEESSHDVGSGTEEAGDSGGLRSVPDPDE